MNDRDRRGNHQQKSLSGELLVIIAVAVLVTTIALLRLAVQRERAVGIVRSNLQVVSSWLITGPAEAVRVHVTTQ